MPCARSYEDSLHMSFEKRVAYDMFMDNYS